VGFLRAEVVTWAPERERFAELAAAWFTQTRDVLFPEVDRGLKAGPSLAFDHAKDPEAPMGPPGGAYGTLWVGRGPAPVGGSRARYSDRAWQRMLDGFATAYPYHAELIAEELDDRGLPARRGEHPVIGVHRTHVHPGWVMLRARASCYERDAYHHVTEVPFPAEVPMRWAEFVKAWVTRADAAYAHVTDDPEIMGGTGLEDATLRNPELTVPRSREELRGYSWVTVCAPELAARLGGAAALAASGAFAEVTELPGGQVYLRATPAPEDYQGDAVRRVFEVLAPVLLTGRPDPRSSATALARLVHDADAADYR
jgi:hypothetical protein